MFRGFHDRSACLAYFWILPLPTLTTVDRRPETPGARATPKTRSAHHPLPAQPLRTTTPRCAELCCHAHAPHYCLPLLPQGATPPLLLRCYRTVSHRHGCYVSLMAANKEERAASLFRRSPKANFPTSETHAPRPESDERPGTEPRPSKPPRPPPAPRFVIRVRNTVTHVHSTSARTAERRPRRRRRGGTGRGSEEARVSSSLDSRSVDPPSRSWRSSYSSRKADSYVIANTV